MKRLLLLSAVMGTLVLGGCATTIGTTVGGTTGAVDPTVEAVQNTAVKICGFVPTVTTVAGVITTFTGGGAIAGIVGQVAQAICNAVVPKKTALRRAVSNPTVNGVRVQGYFIR